MSLKNSPSFRAIQVLTAVAVAASLPLFSQTSVLTQHNDIGRNGQNVTETVLTPTNVTTSSFGKLFSLSVDGQVYAQPLYMPAVTINGQAHRVVFVATEHDSVFAFDAALGGAPLWQASLFDTAHGAAGGATTDPESDTGCGDISALNGASEYGITGTPVIDPSTGTLYVVAKTLEAGNVIQRLHALDITTGNEKFGGPVTIQPSVRGTGNGSSGGVLNFDSKYENQRPGLLLLNGNVYVGFAAHCDYGPWHGWVLGYNAATLAPSGVFVATPNGAGSGVWMGGAGLAADNINNVPRMFPVTGNGSYDATKPYGTNTMDYGDDIIQLTLTNGMSVTDAFTPDNQSSLSGADSDVGSGGAIVLPDQPGSNPHLLAELGKSGALYLVNRDHMGDYSTSANNIVQQVQMTGGLWGMPAYWNGNLYVWPEQGKLSRFSLTNGLLSTSPVEVSPQTESAWYGSTPSISANGATAGIVWSIDWSQNPEVLYAHNATNVSQLLWSSAQNASRDAAGTNVKFVVPTIADGTVFVGALNQVSVYGLLNHGGKTQTITFNPITTHTAATTLALNASASSGLTVTFTSSTPGVCSVSGANASLLTSGTCTIVATQAGNSTYAAATPVSQSFTVNHAAQTITFGSIATQSAGTTISLGATATSGLAITYASSTTSTCTVSGSTASLLAAGTCTIAASQPGNSTYAAATPVSQSFTVTAAKGTFKLSASSGTVTVTPPVCFFIFCFGGSSATDKITITPTGGFTGTVNFNVTGLPTGVSAAFNPGSVTTSGSTTLTLTPSSSAAANRSTTLTINGSAGNSASASTTITLNY